MWQHGRVSDPTGLPPPLRIRPCRSRPACVASVGDDPRLRLEPIPFAGSLDSAQERLRHVLAATRGVRLVVDEPGYLATECRSLVFRFVDDLHLELVASPDGTGGWIHFRSKSRIGNRDLGVNRRRVEKLRSRFERAGE